jgi:DNA-directed RNA polymerase specialized sigma24 family protein
VSRDAEQVADLALVRAVAAGDELALAELYHRHAGWLLVRLRRRCASAETVELALQDTFLDLWRNAASYRGQGEVGVFLWGIAIRRLIDTMRTDRRSDRVSQLAARVGACRS